MKKGTVIEGGGGAAAARLDDLSSSCCTPTPIRLPSVCQLVFEALNRIPILIAAEHESRSSAGARPVPAARSCFLFSNVVRLNHRSCVNIPEYDQDKNWTRQSLFQRAEMIKIMDVGFFSCRNV